MPRNPCRVVIRTRPTANFATRQLVINSNEGTIIVNNSSEYSEVEGPSNKRDCWKFKFHGVLHNVSQDTVYEALAREIVQGSLDGINGTLISYGQTGAGKTFTMIGDTRSYQQRGVAPRALSHIFQEVQNRHETLYGVTVTYMEIYNEKIFDLLAPEQTDAMDLVIVEDAKTGRGSYVKGLIHKQVNNEKEALDQLFIGDVNRTTATHRLNKRSNRSHCIFTVHMSQRSRVGSSERVLHSKLNLVDLAGSERLKKTMGGDEKAASSGTNAGSSGAGDESSDDIIKKESMHINQSLTYLEQTIVALSKKDGNGYVPYRQTKLTAALKDSLGGNCNTLMFACIWGEAKHLEETISTLKLAQRMMRVQNETNVVVETDQSQLVKKLAKQVKELKQELMMHDALVDRSGVCYEEYTPEQKQDVMDAVRRYVDAKPDDEDSIIHIESIRQIREFLRQFKLLVRQAEANQSCGSRHNTRHGMNGIGSTSGGSTRADPNVGDYNNVRDAELVGEEVNKKGFAVGVAPDEARPSSMDFGVQQGSNQLPSQIKENTNSVRQGTSEPQQLGRHIAVSNSPGKESSSAGLGGTDSPMSLSKQDAFENFKAGAGSALNKIILDLKTKVKELKARSKTMTSGLNDTKREIDGLKFQIDEKKRTRSTTETFEGVEGEDVIDEEEFRLIRLERHAKKSYKSGYEDLQSLRAELDNLMQKLSIARADLVSQFEVYFQEKYGEMDPNDSPTPVYSMKKTGVQNISQSPARQQSIVRKLAQDEDELDDGERFERIEMERVCAENPDSLAFFQAQKSLRRASGSPRKVNRRR